jgi:hypothetical protein
LPLTNDLDELDDLAAVARVECYRFYGAEPPPGGGEPALTPRAKAARDAKKATAKAAEPAKVCPVHFITLPASGICDECE